MKKIKMLMVTMIFSVAISGTAAAGGLSDLLETLETTNKVLSEAQELHENLSGKHGNRHNSSHGNSHSSYEGHGYDPHHGYDDHGGYDDH